MMSPTDYAVPFIMSGSIVDLPERKPLIDHSLTLRRKAARLLRMAQEARDRVAWTELLRLAGNYVREADEIERRAAHEAASNSGPC
jgi:hypothetical protein